MDNFMDKIAQKLGAQEAIRANAAADAAQIDKLESQVAEYDACMKEMRKLNLKNAENEEKLKELLEESSRQIRESLEKSAMQLGQLLEKSTLYIKSLTEEGIMKIQNVQEKAWGNMQETESRELKEALDKLKDIGSGVQESLEERKSHDNNMHGLLEAVKGNGSEAGKLLQEVKSSSSEMLGLLREWKDNDNKVQELLQERKRDGGEANGQLQELKGSQKDVRELLQTMQDGNVQKQADDNREEMRKLLEEMKGVFAADREKTEELFKQSDDFAHKENVKVYRNVQAVVVEEMEKQTKAFMEREQQAASKNKLAFVFNVATLAAAAANLVLWIAYLTGRI